MAGAEGDGLEEERKWVFPQETQADLLNLYSGQV